MRMPESPDSQAQQAVSADESGEQSQEPSTWNGYGPPPVREYQPPAKSSPEPTAPSEPVESDDAVESTAWNGYGPPPVREPKPAAEPPAAATESTEPVASSDPAEATASTRPPAWNGYGPPPARETDEAEKTNEAGTSTPAADPPQQTVSSSDPDESPDSGEPSTPADSTTPNDSAEPDWNGAGPPPIRRREPVIPVYPKKADAARGGTPGSRPLARPGQRWADDEGAGPPPSNRMAIAAIILGAASIPFGLTGYLGVIAALFAIVFGIIGLRQAKRGRSTRPRLALAGTILGIVGLVLSIVVLVVSVHKINDCKKHIGHTPNRQELTQCAREHI
jgi:hypothetical protein